MDGNFEVVLGDITGPVKLSSSRLDPFTGAIGLCRSRTSEFGKIDGTHIGGSIDTEEDFAFFAFFGFLAERAKAFAEFSTLVRLVCTARQGKQTSAKKTDSLETGTLFSS